MMSRPNVGMCRNYARWRARQIAYGRWQPWTNAGQVPGTVQKPRHRR